VTSRLVSACLGSAIDYISILLIAQNILVLQNGHVMRQTDLTLADISASVTSQVN